MRTQIRLCSPFEYNSNGALFTYRTNRVLYCIISYCKANSSGKWSIFVKIFIFLHTHTLNEKWSIRSIKEDTMYGEWRHKTSRIEFTIFIFSYDIGTKSHKISISECSFKFCNIFTEAAWVNFMCISCMRLIQFLFAIF